jgi:hypothetical protein
MPLIGENREGERERIKITSGKLRNICYQLVRDKQAKLQTNDTHPVLKGKGPAIRHIICLKLSVEMYTVYLANYIAGNEKTEERRPISDIQWLHCAKKDNSRYSK